MLNENMGFDFRSGQVYQIENLQLDSKCRVRDTELNAHIFGVLVLTFS